MRNIHTLILPDIHGRSFWKEAIEKYNKNKFPNLTIVFLGDYVDPYEFEGVSRQDAIDNFQEIIDVAKSDNRIHLLIGNHDMHYWYDAEYKSRVDSKNYNKIKDMFLQNFTLFNVAYEEIINDKRYLYTHAGVSSFWLQHLQFVGKMALSMHIDRLREEQIEFCEFLSNFTLSADNLNQLKLNFQGQANLWMASYARGGDNSCGSCIWEDWTEWLYKGMEIKGLWQIFGHSRWSKTDPDDIGIDRRRHIACIDTASAWTITDKGTLSKFKHKNERFKRLPN